jgi:hypothetical protein
MINPKYWPSEIIWKLWDMMIWLMNHGCLGDEAKNLCDPEWHGELRYTREDTDFDPLPICSCPMDKNLGDKIDRETNTENEIAIKHRG